MRRAPSSMLFAMVTLACTAGCGASVRVDGGAGGAGSSSSSTSTATASASTGPMPLACVGSGTSSLPGVSIAYAPQPCTFSLSDPSLVAITYQVVVAHDVGGVTPTPKDAGQCDTPGPSGLTTFEQVEGNGQGYCLCDVGLCPPMPSALVTLKAGTYPITFAWDKRNWSGPSDTVNPEGPAFPPGDYTLTASAEGKVLTPGGETPFSISGTLSIHLVP